MKLKNHTRTPKFKCKNKREQKKKKEEEILSFTRTNTINFARIACEIHSINQNKAACGRSDVAWFIPGPCIKYVFVYVCCRK